MWGSEVGVGEELPCGEERGGEVLEAWAVRVAQRAAGEWKRLSVAELCVEPPKERIPWAAGSQGSFPLYLVYTQQGASRRWEHSCLASFSRSST